MDNKTHYLSVFYFLGCGIRDTLEYFIGRPEYSVQAFNTKKRLIEQGLQENHPFAIFCNQQGELGTKIHKQLVDLYNLVYSDEKRTFLHVSDTQIEVDLNQGIKVLDLIVPLKTTITSICFSLINSFNEEEKKEVETIVKTEHEFYASIAGLILYQFAFLNKFKKFNEEKRAHNGEDSVESNFTVSELQKLVSIFNYIKKQAGTNYASFNKVVEEFDKVVDITSGKVQLQEGQNMFELIKEGMGKINAIVNPIEVEFHKQHDAFFKVCLDFEKEMQEKINSETKN